MTSSYRTGEVAALLGVSADTVRRWCDEGRIPTARSESGQRVIDGAGLAAYLRENPIAPAPEWAGRTSARNRLTGIVTNVQRDGLTAIVEIQAGAFRIVSLTTREAADELGLEPGDLAVAWVKSTNVVVEVAPG